MQKGCSSLWTVVGNLQQTSNRWLNWWKLLTYGDGWLDNAFLWFLASILFRTCCFMWVYWTFIYFITHFFILFNQTWKSSYGVSVPSMFHKVWTHIQLRKIRPPLFNKVQSLFSKTSSNILSRHWSKRSCPRNGYHMLWRMLIFKWTIVWRPWRGEVLV